VPQFDEEELVPSVAGTDPHDAKPPSAVQPTVVRAQPFGAVPTIEPVSAEQLHVQPMSAVMLGSR
jgi:hypothetical protein